MLDESKNINKNFIPINKKCFYKELDNFILNLKNNIENDKFNNLDIAKGYMKYFN